MIANSLQFRFTGHEAQNILARLLLLPGPMKKSSSDCCGVSVAHKASARQSAMLSPGVQGR